MPIMHVKIRCMVVSAWALLDGFARVATAPCLGNLQGPASMTQRDDLLPALHLQVFFTMDTSLGTYLIKNITQPVLCEYNVYVAGPAVP
jgi:hypothetical protein